MRKIIILAIIVIIVLGILSGMSIQDIAAWVLDLLKIFFSYIGNLIGKVAILLQNYIGSLSV